jgi:hypothetical protein
VAIRCSPRHLWSDSALQPKLFELSRLNAQLYQVHSRLKQESAAAAAPDQIERLRASIRALDATIGGLMVEIERLRATDPSGKGRS